MLKTIAIDDEPIALEVIKSLSQDIVFIDLAECFTNAFKAVDYLQKNKIDLVFLDIKMPGLSGLDFVRSLNNPPLVIFTTAYSEHAVQSFELNAIDYLLKPFSQVRFLKACNKAFEQFELRKVASAGNTGSLSLFIKSGYDLVRVELDDILYAESSRNYVDIVTTTKTITTRLTMNEVETMLPTAKFIRIHRSFIVARNRIDKLDKKWVWTGDKQLPLGTAYIGEVEKALK